jgi:hypothetical protein
MKWLLQVLALVIVICTQLWIPLMIYAAMADDKDSQWVWDWLVNIISPIDRALSSRA